MDARHSESRPLPSLCASPHLQCYRQIGSGYPNVSCDWKKKKWKTFRYCRGNKNHKDVFKKNKNRKKKEHKAHSHGNHFSWVTTQACNIIIFIMDNEYFSSVHFVMLGILLFKNFRTEPKKRKKKQTNLKS